MNFHERLKKRLEICRNYGPIFWATAFFSLLVLASFWTEAARNNDPTVIQNVFLKWAVTPIETIRITINIFEKDMPAIPVELTPLLIFVSFYVAHNIKRRIKNNNNYIKKPGEWIVGLYLVSWGIMMFLSPFVSLTMPKYFGSAVVSLALLYLPSQGVKYFENNNPKS